MLAYFAYFLNHVRWRFAYCQVAFSRSVSISVFESFFLIKNTLELTSAGETCLTPRSGCEVLNNTNPEELLTDTVDHIFYSTPATYEIKVLTAQRNFTETFNNKPLSDHLGYEAVFSINKK